MGNVLLNQNPKPSQSPNSIINQLKSLKSTPSNVLFNKMYNDNPDFRRFADTVRGMSPEEAFSQYGLDFNNFRNQKW